jgi:hypothetical protein
MSYRIEGVKKYYQPINLATDEKEIIYVVV